MFIKVQLHGLGWESTLTTGGEGLEEAYQELLPELAEFIKQSRYVGVLKTATVGLCKELDEIHYTKDSELLVQESGFRVLVERKQR